LIVQFVSEKGLQDDISVAPGLRVGFSGLSIVAPACKGQVDLQIDAPPVVKEHGVHIA
jgi:hypothetical protein